MENKRYVVISRVVKNGRLESLRLLDNVRQNVVEIFPKSEGEESYRMRVGSERSSKDLDASDVREFGEFLPVGVIAAIGRPAVSPEHKGATKWFKGLWGSCRNRTVDN